jgi:hypothetical protein
MVMASVSSTSSVSQFGLQQLSVQQAKRNADQAEQDAQALRQQANAAQAVADREQKDAQSLAIQSGQAEERAGLARQGLAVLTSAQQGMSQLSGMLDQVISRQAAPAPTVHASSASPAPVVNTQGQITGTIINTKT